MLAKNHHLCTETGGNDLPLLSCDPSPVFSSCTCIPKIKNYSSRSIKRFVSPFCRGRVRHKTWKILKTSITDVSLMSKWHIFHDMTAFICMWTCCWYWQHGCLHNSSVSCGYIRAKVICHVGIEKEENISTELNLKKTSHCFKGFNDFHLSSVK